MGFVILLVAYVMRRFLDSSPREGAEGWLRRALARFPGVAAGREARAGLGLALLVLLVVAVAVLNIALQRSPVWPLTWLLDLVVLLAMMGVPGWRNPLGAYGEAWRRGDAQAAWHHVNHLLPAPERGLATEPRELHRLLARQFVAVVFERYFLVIFWYVLAGPAGAVGARLAVALRDHWPHPAGRETFARFVFPIAWIPARLLSISFGVAGDLAGWMGGAGRRILSPGMAAADLLFDSANRALSSYSLDPDRFARTHPDEWQDYGERSLRAVRDLMNRSLFVWICALALLAIGGVFT
ncbi:MULTISPECIES: regulatory signaling modulator protein AmpE [Marinobacter]|uniref:regulatory signaling modulator protein AmpE n=1 Tax=Marinobacter TaxID=2742 RepID=UPI000DAB3BD8|nr:MULTISPECIES: regulatory signaling modulator protein AmpE [Marinobacter]